MAYIVPPSRHFAGVERVVTEIADGIAGRSAGEFEVHVIFCNDFEELRTGAHEFRLHIMRAERLLSLFRPLRRLAREQRFDVVICAQVEPSVPAWLATRGLGVRAFVTHMHGNPRMEIERGGRSSRFAFWVFRSFIASRIAAMFCVSPSLTAFVRRLVPAARQVEFAPNPVRQLVGASAVEPVEPYPPRFLNVGRLSHQKGQDVLLSAFAQALLTYPDATLTIVGRGEDEAALHERADALRIAGSVNFAGYQADPSPYFSDANQFVSSARWEGMGGVILEALQVGLPVVSTACDFGPTDLIEDERIGRLAPVDDPSALAEAMIASARTPSTTEAIRARRAIAARFDLDRVAEAHLGLLRGLVRRF